LKLKRLAAAFAFLILLLVMGAAGYSGTEGISFFNALWLAVTTIATIGYGDIVPQTVGGRLITVLLAFGGIGVAAYAVGTGVSLVVEGHLQSVMGVRRMRQRIERLRDHMIVCGGGRVGLSVADYLKQEHVPFVVIDQHRDRVEQFWESGMPAIQGDATLEEILHQAGISRAAGLIAALSSDAENVFVTLTAKQLNRKLRVVARMERPESEGKLLQAGADKVVSPARIGAQRMAISLLKPASVDYLETLMHEKFEFELEEIHISDCSPLANQKLGQSAISQDTAVNLLAIVRENAIVSNPGPDEVIRPGDLLILIGMRGQLSKFEVECKE